MGDAVKANAERKTWAGHGHPQEFVFLGLGKTPDESMASNLPATVTKEEDGLHITSGFSGWTVTPNTKFWALVGDVSRTPVEVDGLGAAVAKMNTLETENAELRQSSANAAAIVDELQGRVDDLLAECQGLREETDRLRNESRAPTGQTGLDTPVSLVEVPGDALEWVRIPAEAWDSVLDEMEEAGREAALRAEKIRRNPKASYSDRLQKGFLDGTAKTAAYFLGKLKSF